MSEELEEAIAGTAGSSGEKKKKKKKRRRKNPFLRFFVFLCVCGALWLFATSEFFTVTSIEVEGNKYYTKAQVVDIAGLQTGYNLFSTPVKDAKAALLADPYIKIVNIKKIPRGTIKITIEERPEYAAVPYGDQYVLIDESGMVLRIADQQPVLPLLQGMSIIEMTPGNPLLVEQTYLLTDTLALISVMEENDLFFKTINFSTVIVKAYIYDSYYCEGAPANIIANIQAVKQLLEEHYKQGITRGVIRVGKDNYLAFDPNIE